METTEPLLSICIVSYNTRDLLEECLRSLYNSIQIPFEIIITDNHSTDGTQEMLNRDFSAIRVIQNAQNLGYTLPMNQALRAACSKHFLVQLNPDTLVQPKSFDYLLDFFAKHPDAGICTPKILNRDGTLQKQCRRSAARPWDAISYSIGLGKLFPQSRQFNGYLMGYHDEDEIHPVEAVSGACMVIRRQVIDQIGYLDEQFFAFQEDTEFCFRAREAGWKIYYVPTARIIHYGGQGGSQTDLPKSIRAWHYSYYRYYRKHLAKDYFFIFNQCFYAIMYIKMLIALALAGVKRRNYVGSPKP